MVECIDDPAFGLDISFLQNRLDILQNAEAPPQRRALLRRIKLFSVIRRGASEREQAPILVHELGDGLRQSPADSIGVDVDTIRECGLELLLEVFGSIVDARVDSKIIKYPLASIGATAEADHITPGDLCKLRSD